MPPLGSQRLPLILDRKSKKEAVEWDPWETVLHFVLGSTRSVGAAWLFFSASEKDLSCSSDLLIM